MNKRKVPTSQKTHQITNLPTNQGRPRAKLCLCRGMQRFVVSFGPSRGRGIHQINRSQGAGSRFVDLPAKGPLTQELPAKTQRIEYPPCQFIVQRINYLERGVTKP